ncbi:hypothetical protein BH10CHL1_BH10CHL1_36720 [soil metagenome]
MFNILWYKSNKSILKTNGDQILAGPDRHVSLSPCLFGFMLICTLFLAGCFRRSNVPNMSFDLNELLPAGWTAVGAVREIDIDDDPTLERLVFFSYDKSPQTNAGPIGALIYDLHEDKGIVTNQGAAVANQSSSSLVRYQILPSYWQGAGQGFIAEPSQAANILVYPVTYAAIDSQGAAMTRKELVVRGGATYLTFIWWKGTVEGYGVAQLYAPGGFQGIDWTEWEREPKPINQITGLYPLHDRNSLCRKVTYDRNDVAPTMLTPLIGETIAYRQEIYYKASNRGLDFCDGAPTHPFYPEGVVLAYLLDAKNRTDLLDPSLQSSIEITRVQSVVDPGRLILVDDLHGQQDIPITNPTVVAPGVTIQTRVCAKVMAWTDATATTFEPRWLLFTLQHQSSTPDASAVDQLAIVNVNQVAASTEGGLLDCTQVIQTLTK